MAMRRESGGKVAELRAVEVRVLAAKGVPALFAGADLDPPLVAIERAQGDRRLLQPGKPVVDQVQDRSVGVALVPQPLEQIQPGLGACGLRTTGLGCPCAGAREPSKPWLFERLLHIGV